LNTITTLVDYILIIIIILKAVANSLSYFRNRVLFA